MLEPVPAWRRWIMVALIGLALCVASFSAGRFSAPEQVRERIEYRSLAVEDITAGFKWDHTWKRTTKRDVKTTITPDAGTTVEDKSVIVEGSDTHAEGTEVAKRTESTEKISEKTVTLQPRLRLGADVGASLVKPWLPITGPLVVGASLEFRLVGGVWVGVWINTVGAAGGRIAGEF